MPSSSRPYQSKILNFILSQFQQGVERHRRAVRQVRSAAAWGVQVALSPIYAVMRAARLADRQLGQGSAKRLPLLGWFRRPAQENGEQLAQATAIPEASEKPITQILEVAQQCLEPEQKSALRLTVPARISWFSQLFQPQETLSKLMALKGLQGIASDVETRAIVLVGPGNQLWSGLTVAQQSFLQNQIWTLIQANDPLHQAASPLPTALRWRLSSFGPRRFLGFLRGRQSRPMLVFEGEVTSESLITQFLADVQRVLPAEQRLQCLPATEQRVPVMGGLERQTTAQTARGEPGRLQGIASDLTSQALILVGANNVLWDVLTPHQQDYLKQQIWALMDAYGYHQRQTLDLKQRVISWLPVPKRIKRFLGNSFNAVPTTQGGTLAAVGTDQGMMQNTNPWESLPGAVKGSNGAGAKVWLAGILAWLAQLPQPEQLRSSGSKSGLQLPWQRPPLPLPWRWRQPQALPETVHRESAPLTPVQPSAPVHQTPRGGIWGRYGLPESNYLETEVTSIEYIEHPLEKLLRWIDGVLSWIETLWRRLVSWLQPKVEP